MKRKILTFFIRLSTYYNCRNIFRIQKYFKDLLLENHRAYLVSPKAASARYLHAFEKHLPRDWTPPGSIFPFRAIHDSRDTERSRVYTPEKPRGKDRKRARSAADGERVGDDDWWRISERGKLKFMNTSSGVGLKFMAELSPGSSKTKTRGSN